MTRKQKKNLFRILAAAVLLAVAAVLPAEGWLRLAVFAVPYAVVGYDVLWGALRNILRGQVFDERFLMAVATVGAFFVAEFPEAVMVMLFYQLGEWFQSIAVGRSRKSIAALMDIRPESATVLRGGGEQEVFPQEVQVGESIVVRPGERIPLDGVITEGQTVVDTAALTGESLPRDCGVGEAVLSGSVNLSAEIRVEVTKPYEESTVSKILDLVENSATKKAKSERFITRFARWYTPCVVVGALVLAVVPSLFLGNWGEWIHRALIFLVVSCPCALVISVPLSFFGGIGGASKKGILIKGSNYMETLASVQTVVFDKTGTLTRGDFTVTYASDPAVAALAAAVESHSNHPIARSVCRSYRAEPAAAREVRELAGKGLCAVVDGKSVAVGNQALMDELGLKTPSPVQSGTVVHVAAEGEYLGYLVLNDTVKPDAAEALLRLKDYGVTKTVILTGDVEASARPVAEQLGVDELHSGLLPHQKVEQVERLLSEGRLAFVGDGINDAPVLTRADLGIAMGALGSDAAIEAADVVLMDDQPSKIAEAVRIARRTMRIVKQNIAFSLAVKGLVLLLGIFGLAPMLLAIFADVGVMVLAILNSMRTLKNA